MPLRKQAVGSIGSTWFPDGLADIKVTPSGAVLADPTVKASVAVSAPVESDAQDAIYTYTVFCGKRGVSQCAALM